MNQSELRLGNIISYRGETECIVSSLGSKGFETVKNDKYQSVYGSDDIRDYEPIKLTEEILLNSGFDKDGFIDIGDDQSFSIFNGDILMGGFDACTSGHCFSFHIEYVHELQNIFIDLKKELNINI